MAKELKTQWGEITKVQPWFQFHDLGIGKGFANPDIVIEFPDRICLIETKLTGGPHGRLQMEWLYRPILEKVFGKPVVCLLVCKWITGDTPGPTFHSIEEFLAAGVPFGSYQWI